MQFTADAVEHSAVAEVGDVVEFTAPKDFSLTMRPEDLQKALQRVCGRPVKVKITLTESAVEAAPARGSCAGRRRDHQGPRAGPTAVQRYQEVFPGSQVRTVRNLKEGS